jgi:hypothetical protein
MLIFATGDEAGQVVETARHGFRPPRHRMPRQVVMTLAAPSMLVFFVDVGLLHSSGLHGTDLLGSSLVHPAGRGPMGRAAQTSARAGRAESGAVALCGDDVNVSGNHETSADQ